MSTDIKYRLALRIRELREKCGYTQEKLAELADIDYKHIQLLESKHRDITTEVDWNKQQDLWNKLIKSDQK